MSKVIPLIKREVESYRHWLRVSSDPLVLRDVGLCICDDLEESLILLEELNQEHPNQLHLPLGWQVIEGGVDGESELIEIPIYG